MTVEFRIIKGSQGSFLDPPDSPTTKYSVVGWYSGHRTREPDASMSLDYALSDPDVPEVIKARIRKLYEDADMQPTEEWLAQVYSYFKNCYSPDGEDRNVSRCLIISPNLNLVTVSRGVNYTQLGFGYAVGTFGKDGWITERPDPSTSLAVMHIRKFFPDHEVRMDLLDKPKGE